MAKKVLKTILFVISIYLFTTFLTFFLIYITQPNLAVTYLQAAHIPINQGTIAHANNLFGFNQSPIMQYLNWLNGIFHGDWGKSYVMQISVAKIIVPSFLKTFLLTGASSFFILALSLILSSIMTFSRYSYIKKSLFFLSNMMVSIPQFVIGYILILIFGVKLKIFPVSGISTLASYVMPVLTLSFPYVGKYTVYISSLYTELRGETYITNAYLIGVKFRYILIHHFLKNISIPLISSFIMDYLGLLTGSVIVETVFSWPGFGEIFLQSILNRDIPMIQFSILIFCTIFIIGIFLNQFLTNHLNPTIRRKL